MSTPTLDTLPPLSPVWFLLNLGEKGKRCTSCGHTPSVRRWHVIEGKLIGVTKGSDAYEDEADWSLKVAHVSYGEGGFATESVVERNLYLTREAAEAALLERA